MARSSKQPQLIGTHRLILDTVRFLKLHWQGLGKILLVIALVNMLLNFGLGAETAGFYQSIWFVFGSCALIWGIRHAEDKKTKLSLAGAFYNGTAPALRFFLTLILVAIVTLPFSFGAFVYSVITALAAGTSALEQILAGLLWLGLSLVSLIFLARLSFSLLIVTLPDIRPWQALKLSWGLARGRTNQLVIRLGIFTVYLGLASLAVIAGISYLGLNTAISNIILSLLGNLVVLPLVYGYLYKLYRTLK